MKPRDVFSVEGKAAIVTGGALGIGFGIVKRLVEGGAEVLATDVDAKALKDLPNRLGKGKVRTLPLDVSKDAGWEKSVKACVNAFGKLDILVNNAGVYPQAPVLGMDPKLFDRILSINLRGLVFLSKAAAHRMIRQGHGGRIINIASVDSVHPSMVGLAAYDASKGAVLSFTKNFALETAPFGINVNAVAPGATATEGTSRPLEGSGMTPKQMADWMAGFVKEKVPLGRMGTPEDIAAAVQFLASEAASYMTGSLMVVDGGMLLK